MTSYSTAENKTAGMPCRRWALAGPSNHSNKSLEQVRTNMFVYSEVTFKLGRLCEIWHRNIHERSRFVRFWHAIAHRTLKTVILYFEFVFSSCVVSFRVWKSGDNYQILPWEPGFRQHLKRMSQCLTSNKRLFHGFAIPTHTPLKMLWLRPCLVCQGWCF